MRIFLTLALLGLFAATPAMAEEKKEVEKFGDWGKQCEKGPDGKQVCYMFQNASNKETGQMIMHVRIGYAPDNPEPIMIAILPLGALLPPGVGLMLEGVEPVKMTFLACAKEGCTTAGQPLKKDILGAMKKGDQALLRVALLNKKVVSLPISLKGFTRAFNSIQP